MRITYEKKYNAPEYQCFLFSNQQNSNNGRTFAGLPLDMCIVIFQCKYLGWLSNMDGISARFMMLHFIRSAEMRPNIYFRAILVKYTHYVFKRFDNKNWNDNICCLDGAVHVGALFFASSFCVCVMSASQARKIRAHTIR